jgi:hypothetical protein
MNAQEPTGIPGRLIGTIRRSKLAHILEEIDQINNAV